MRPSSADSNLVSHFFHFPLFNLDPQTGKLSQRFYLGVPVEVLTRHIAVSGLGFDLNQLFEVDSDLNKSIMTIMKRTVTSLRGLTSAARPSRFLPLATLSYPSHTLHPASGVHSIFQQRCYSSHSPLSPTASAASPRKKVTLPTLHAMYKRNEPITMLTAHDFPSAHVADAAGMDVVLVGDSLAMVALGMEDTSEVLVEEMLLHCRSVARATRSAFTVSLSPSHTRIDIGCSASFLRPSLCNINTLSCAVVRPLCWHILTTV